MNLPNRVRALSRRSSAYMRGLAWHSPLSHIADHARRTHVTSTPACVRRAAHTHARLPGARTEARDVHYAQTSCAAHKHAHVCGRAHLHAGLVQRALSVTHTLAHRSERAVCEHKHVCSCARMRLVRVCVLRACKHAHTSLLMVPHASPHASLSASAAHVRIVLSARSYLRLPKNNNQKRALMLAQHRVAR